MFKIIGECSAEDSDIIEVNKYAGKIQVLKDAIHCALECCGCIKQSLGHALSFEQSLRGDEFSFFPVFGSKVNLPVPRS